MTTNSSQEHEGALAPEPTNLAFESLNIAEPVLKAIIDLGFKTCTPIQAQSLPHALTGKDVGGKAQTGTGKTAAFLITAFTRLLNEPREDLPPGSPRVLILAPTRELAIQICKDADLLAKYTGLKNLVVYGGAGYKEQQRALEGRVDLVVATPGRLIDYAGQRLIDLKHVDILVIDEADRMLDMGFIPDVRRIVRRTPPPGKRQTLLFSATLTGDILRLVETWMDNPKMIEIEAENLVTDLVQQVFYSVPSDKRLSLVLWHLAHDNVERMLIFANRRDTTDNLARDLESYEVPVGLLSGDVPQRKRMHILEEFRAGTIPVIVATDVAARGIHVDNVSHVVNWDLPYEPDDYVHRIGRTGRAGVSGKAISLADEYGSFIIPDLEQYLGQEIRCEQPDDEMVQPLPEPPRAKHVRRRPPRGDDRSHDRRGGGGRSRGGGGGGRSSGPRRSGRRG